VTRDAISRVRHAAAVERETSAADALGQAAPETIELSHSLVDS
jgi:hypothetical protein